MSVFLLLDLIDCLSGIRQSLNQAEQKSEQYYQDYYSYDYINQIPNCHMLIILRAI